MGYRITRLSKLKLVFGKDKTDSLVRFHQLSHRNPPTEILREQGLSERQQVHASYGLGGRFDQ
jgi:hypothetical protein